ncbi:MULTISPECIES: hypothetical protein [Rufibacter]|uniref:Uncharacterized protein n=1 Tax=Rufibacter quisquiliarum TaxID=1549639 RepID=A0A839GX02_9BACT|nr:MULTISPECIES: hypothetical protein [Rufibacter]MBA9079387.1 hypothetical protein [Rufibacter quisquiliarum]
MTDFYSAQTEPITVENLVLAMRLSRMGHSSEFITGFVTGSWSPMPAAPAAINEPCLDLVLPGRQRVAENSWSNLAGAKQSA